MAKYTPISSADDFIKPDGSQKHQTLNETKSRLTKTLRIIEHHKHNWTRTIWQLIGYTFLLLILIVGFGAAAYYLAVDDNTYTWTTRTIINCVGFVLAIIDLITICWIMVDGFNYKFIITCPANCVCPCINFLSLNEKEAFNCQIICTLVIIGMISMVLALWEHCLWILFVILIMSVIVTIVLIPVIYRKVYRVHMEDKNRYYHEKWTNCMDDNGRFDYVMSNWQRRYNLQWECQGLIYLDIETIIYDYFKEPKKEYKESYSSSSSSSR